MKRALSQEALAVDAGVDRLYAARIERGVENPTAETHDRLAKVLEVSAAELLSVPKSTEKPPATLRRGRKKKR